MFFFARDLNNQLLLTPTSIAKLFQQPPFTASFRGGEWEGRDGYVVLVADQKLPCPFRWFDGREIGSTDKRTVQTKWIHVESDFDQGPEFVSPAGECYFSSYSGDKNGAISWKWKWNDIHSPTSNAEGGRDVGSQPVKLRQLGGWRREHFVKVYHFLYLPLISQSPVIYY